MRHRGFASRTFVGLNGLITIRRARVQRSATKKMHMPLDAVLDLPGGPEAGEALEPLLDYLRPRLSITNYVDHRKAGNTIGSGMIESNCKQVVAKRLKGSGMQWSETGAVAMTALVAHKLNDTWNALWDTRPLQRAA